MDELVAWDGVRGMVLAQEATTNTMRYVEIFSRVVDKKLEAIQRSATAHQSNPATMRDSMDVLQEQRLAQQAARQGASQGQSAQIRAGQIWAIEGLGARSATRNLP